MDDPSLYMCHQPCALFSQRLGCFCHFFFLVCVCCAEYLSFWTVWWIRGWRSIYLTQKKALLMGQSHWHCHVYTLSRMVLLGQQRGQLKCEVISKDVRQSLHSICFICQPYALGLILWIDHGVNGARWVLIWINYRVFRLPQCICLLNTFVLHRNKARNKV